MKSTLLLSTVLAFSLITHVKGNDGEEEKEEMKRAAEEYRRCAAENKSAKLDECDQESPELVKNAATKAIELRHKVGEVEEKLATAYEAGDKKLIHQLHDQKNVAELDAEFGDKEKRVAYAMSQVDDLLKDMPDSPDAKGLKVKTEASMKAYLDNAKKLIELQKEQMRLEKGIDSVDSSIEILRKREELKKLEAESVAQ